MYKSMHILKVYSIHYTLRENPNLKKTFLRIKKTVQKMLSFFFHELQLITVLLLICDSYMRSSTRFVSPKLCVRFSIFNSVSFLLKIYFCLTKCMHSLTLNRHNSFQNSFKSHTQFCFQTSDFQVSTRSFKI